MSKPSRTYAVLTGDLVDWSGLKSADQRKRGVEILKEAAEEVDGVCGGAVVEGVRVFRGDEWQLVLDDPVCSVRAGVFMRAAVKRRSTRSATFDTRVSIGVGGAEWIDESRISESFGTAFTLSGRGLDATRSKGSGRRTRRKGTVHLALAVDEGILPEHAWPEQGLIPLLDCVVSDWSAKESLAVYGTMLGWTQDEVSRHMPVNPKTGKRVTTQAVSSALKRAHWAVVDRVLGFVEGELRQALEV